MDRYYYPPGSMILSLSFTSDSQPHSIAMIRALGPASSAPPTTTKTTDDGGVD